MAKAGLFVLSAGALVCISSITIRVELRWMYFPYVVAIFLLIYLATIKKSCWIYYLKLGCLVIYTITMIGFGIYCRRYYTNLYYWPVYTAANSLTDCTYGIYGEKMYDESWIIVASEDIENSFGDLLNQFDPYDKYELQLQVIRNVNELNGIEDIQNKEILYYDKEEWKFINISKVVKEYYSNQ